jgi:hypothetical protein
MRKRARDAVYDAEASAPQMPVGQGEADVPNASGEPPPIAASLSQVAVATQHGVVGLSALKSSASVPAAVFAAMPV